VAKRRQRMGDFLDQVGLSDGDMADAGVVVLPEIDRILPDPDQPRREVVPEDLRARVLSGDMPAKDAIVEAWQRCLSPTLLKRLQSKRLSAVDALSEQRAAGPRDLALQITLEKLVELADSIAEHGLVQPVSICKQPGGSFQITVGERRWWAHIHLFYMMGDAKARRIKAIEVPTPDDSIKRVGQQYAENVHRSDLSDIARARAVAHIRELVIRELAASGDGDAKVSKAEIDETTGRRVAEITGEGISARSVRRYMALLTLPQEARRVAEVAGISERALRDITGLKDPAEQIRLASSIATQSMSITEAAETAQRIKRAGKSGRAQATGKRPMRSWVRRLQTNVRFTAAELPKAESVAREIASLPKAKRDTLIDRMMAHAKYITDVIGALEKVLPADQE